MSYIETMEEEHFAKYGELMLNTVMEIRGYIDHNDLESERWQASFRYLEFKDGGILGGVFGRGETPREAVRDYIERMAAHPTGQFVMNAYKDNRQHFDLNPDFGLIAVGKDW